MISDRGKKTERQVKNEATIEKKKSREPSLISRGTDGKRQQQKKIRRKKASSALEVAQKRVRLEKKKDREKKASS